MVPLILGNAYMTAITLISVPQQQSSRFWKDPGLTSGTVWSLILFFKECLGFRAFGFRAFGFTVHRELKSMMELWGGRGVDYTIVKG